MKNISYKELFSIKYRRRLIAANLAQLFKQATGGGLIKI